MTETENDWHFTKTLHFALNWGHSVHSKHPNTA